MSDFETRAAAPTSRSTGSVARSRCRKDRVTPHQKAQWGADVRPGPEEGYPLPEGLRKARRVRSIKTPGGDRGRANGDNERFGCVVRYSHE